MLRYYKKPKSSRRISISQTGRGYNVSTYSTNKSRLRIHTNKNVRTLANANKEFTRQKTVLQKRKTY